jgi:outer membrane protein OmpA-like peptidoglycan-associated protein/ABC-type taurine transport system substrate-binding protein
MNELKRLLGLMILAAVAAAGIYLFFIKKEEVKSITYSTSDVRDLKGEYSIALDSWIGYFPLRSPVFGSLMRESGYRVKIIDDNADYAGRMKMLKNGEIDFAVCTVDSYLLNGSGVRYPGAVIAVIDQSKGGDAVVAWKSRVPNIEGLKTGKNISIAFTPASPSEHLLKSIAAHFDIPLFTGGDKKWRVEVNGAEEAYTMFKNNKVDCAVLWEPHVTDALSDPGAVKLIGSEDVENLIVDILVVNRTFAKEKPEMVNLFLQKYFETLNFYKNSPARLKQDITAGIAMKEKSVDSMLKGVKWMYYNDNTSWFGISNKKMLREPEIVDSINSALKILIANGDFSKSPLIEGDPYTIINSSFISDLYGTGGQNKIGDVKADDSLNRRFSKLPDSEWDRLAVVGSLKLRPVTFSSGTSVIDESGLAQIKEITDSIRHYPNFRILVKGHTGLKGDPEENRKLSLIRAEVVKRELEINYGVDPNRIKATGIGSGEPISRQSDESDRAYDNRLKRVELFLLMER